MFTKAEKGVESPPIKEVKPIPEKIKEVDEHLDEILDEVIEKVKEKETLKDFEKMEMEQKQVENNHLYELIMGIKKDILDNKRDEFKLSNVILRKQEATICTVKSIDTKYNKTMAASMALFFLLGIFIGIQHETWIPYIGQLIDVAKATTNIIR